MSLKLTPDQARRVYLRGQGLSSGETLSGDPVEAVTRRVCGLQAQDLFAAMLGVRARAAGSTWSAAERSRLLDRTVVWTWSLRGTMHLTAAEDWPWITALVGPPLVAATKRRRVDLGLDDETYLRGLQVLRELLGELGSATREEVGQALAEAGLPSGYSVERHLLHRAALEGRICCGPDRTENAAGRTPTYALASEWLGQPMPSAADLPSSTELVARLAARYLAAYAPASPEDLAAWSGLRLRDLRDGWRTAAAACVEVEVAGRRAWLPESRVGDIRETAADEYPHVRLLPSFDAYLLGHRSRALVVEPELDGRINAGGGMIRAVVLVNGRVQGTWQTNRKGRRVAATVAPFEPFSPEIEERVAAEIADIERFLAG